MSKKKSAYFLLYALVLAANLVVVLSHISYAKFSLFSLPALFFMLFMILHAALSYMARDWRNFLIFGIFGQRIKDGYSDENEYLEHFFLMLKIYCLAIPFYIPLIFLASGTIYVLWSLIVFFLPQVVFMIIEISEVVKSAKKAKMKSEQLEKERLEQERKEEFGRLK